MYKLLIFFFVSSLYSSELYYSFANVGVNYLDWTQQTHDKTEQEDFAYLSVEGGAGWDWGELYANANLENPTKTYADDAPNDLRYNFFADFDIKLSDGWRVHFQDYYLRGKDYYVNDFIAGFSYKYRNENGFWIKPFLGLHVTNDSYYDGLNGYMAGWTFNYDFSLFEEKFGLLQWNEIEFARNKTFYQNSDGSPTGDGESHGLNGAVDFRWYINKAFTAEVQYRYAKHKLGSIEYQDAFIYTLRYNLL